MATFKSVSCVQRDGSFLKVLLRCERLPAVYLTDKWWVEDGYLFFTGPDVWNAYHYKSIMQRGYTPDVRVIEWDFPGWKPEWGRYSNWHHYFDFISHIFCAKIYVQKPGNVFHIPHCVIKGRPPKPRYNR